MKRTFVIEVGVVLLLASVTINVLQAQKIRELVGPQDRSSQLVGARIDALDGMALSGEPRRIDLIGDVPTVLYFFSSSCGWCERNWRNVEALSDQASGRFRVVAISQEGDLAEFVSSRRLSIDVLQGLSVEQLEQLQLAATPHTLMIDRHGIISAQWSGAYNERLLATIESTLDVLLPGVSPGRISEGPVGPQ
jgi:hypothetical protein